MQNFLIFFFALISILTPLKEPNKHKYVTCSQLHQMQQFPFVFAFMELNHKWEPGFTNKFLEINKNTYIIFLKWHVLRKSVT